jgi:hypothetical protein
MTTTLTKPIARQVTIAGRVYIVELGFGGIMFREAGKRRRMVTSWPATLQLAQEFADRDERREQLARAVDRRLGRSRRMRR